MNNEYVFFLQDCGKRYPGGKQLFADINLSFLAGAKIGILGVNGSGKSTLLRIMAGIEQEFQGEAKAISDLKIGYLPQEPTLDDSLTVSENINSAISSTIKLLTLFEAISEKLATTTDSDELNDLIEQQGETQARIDHVNGWDLERQKIIAMQALECPPGDRKAKVLSGGERRRVALCKLLLQQPDMLLLDEPTNHLDANSIAWLEGWLSKFPGTVVMVTHDRYFLDNVTNWILELDNGTGIPYRGSYSSWLEQKQERLAHQTVKQQQLKRQLAQEREWISNARKGSRPQTKNRLTAYKDLYKQYTEHRRVDTQITIPAGPRLGAQVLQVDGLSKSYDDQVLFQDLSFTLSAGAILGIIGGNGSGKTSLLRIILQQEQPDRGQIIVGETVQMAYVDQSRDALKAENTVWQEVSGGSDTIKLGTQEVASRAYVAAFNFRGSDQQRRVADLSGGERNRIHLAKLLRTGGNLLLLDEPTNDLDVATLRALEEGLEQFPGSAIVVSHDRWFLDRIATHILAADRSGSWRFFSGNYSEYIEKFPDTTKQ